MALRRRHRRPDVAHRQPADPARPHHPRRGDGVRHDARLLLGDDARHPRQLDRRRAARLHHLLLRRDLHDGAEALDRAEHRDRRRRRRAAAGGGLGRGDRHRRVEPLLLFAIIFFWTPPHFWALALFRSDDYARAGVPMLPVVAGPDATRLQILLYTIVLVAIAAAPWPLGYFDADLRRHLADPRRRHAGARRQRLCPPRAQPVAARHPQAVCLLDPLSVRAVCDPAGRGRRPRACSLVG